MTTMTAKSPEDVLAAIPVVLGFHPEDSIAMLTFGGEHSFHARIDLPGPDEVDSASPLVVQRLLEPVVAQRASSVLFAFYGDDAGVIERVFADLRAACRAFDIVVLDALRVSGGRWFPVGRPGSADSTGTPFDISSHPFAAQAVMDGMVTAGSRSELAARLARDEASVAVVEGLIGRARRLRPGPLRLLLETHAAAGTPLADPDAAAVMRAVGEDSMARTIAWWRVPRPRAESLMRVWIDLIRRAPDAQLADVAGILAMVAWIAGHGSVAWCAIDRGHEVVDEHELLDLVSGLLESGTPPVDDWDSLDELPAAG